MCKIKKMNMIFVVIGMMINIVTMKVYHPGNTVNIYSYNNEVTVSDIFNGFNGTKYVEIKNDSHTSNYRMLYDLCLPFNSLKQYLYPEVLIDRKISTSISSKLFNYMKQGIDRNLNVATHYIDNGRYTYGIVKLCKIAEIQNINIELINWNYFPKFYEYGNYNILINETLIYRLKRDNESHYISSVSLGTCVTQIYVHQKIACDNKTEKTLDDYASFFRDAVYKTPFTTISNNKGVENSMNYYYFMKDIDYSLFKFLKLKAIHQQNILDMLQKNSVVTISLQSLPELPRTVKPKIQSTLINSISKASLEDLNPGYLINLNELLNNEFDHVSIKNIFTDLDSFNSTSSFAVSEYLSCSSLNENENLNLETGKLNIIDELMKPRNYGIDPRHSTKFKSCLKITVCPELFHKEFYISDPIIIKLNQQPKNDVKKNIFENENIITMYSDTNETHLIKHTVKGNCLVQVIVLPFEFDINLDYSRFKVSPDYMGKILSASNNATLEKWAGNLCHNDLRNIIGPQKNESLYSVLFHGLKGSKQQKKALISVYLNELY